MSNDKKFCFPSVKLPIAAYCSIQYYKQCDACQPKSKTGLLSLLINLKFLTFFSPIFLGQGNNNINLTIIPIVC